MGPTTTTVYHTFNLGQFVDLANSLILKMFGASVIIGIFVAVMTFAFLELFMKPGLEYMVTFKPLSKEDKASLSNALMIVASIVIPALVAWRLMPQRIIEAFAVMGFGIFMCWIFSFPFRKYVKSPAARKNKLLFVQAVAMIPEIIAKKYLANWIMATVLKTVNLCINIIHRPFIMEYAIMSLLINFALSVALTSIMGDTATAMAANLGGSAIAAIVHSIKVLATGELRRLRKVYADEAKADAKEALDGAH